MSSSRFDEAKHQKNKLDKNIKRLRAELAMFVGDVTPEYTAAKATVIEAIKDRDKFNRDFHVTFKDKIEAERLARIRYHNRNHDLRYVSSIQQKHLFDQLNTEPSNTERDRRLAKIAFSASGLSVGQTVTLWRRPVVVLGPVSRSQVKVLNNQENGLTKAFESFDRYEAIDEANYWAITAALELEAAPPPAPPPAEKPPVAVPEAEPAPMLNL